MSKTSTTTSGDFNDCGCICVCSEIEPWDEPEWLWQVVLSLLIILEVLGPLFIWMCCCDVSGYLRICSVTSWVFFWLYVPFIPVCVATQCGVYSPSLSWVMVVGFFSAPIMWVLMMVESYRSRERQYISKLGESQTVSKTIQVNVLY